MKTITGFFIGVLLFLAVDIYFSAEKGFENRKLRYRYYQLGYRQAIKDLAYNNWKFDIKIDSMYKNRLQKVRQALNLKVVK